MDDTLKANKKEFIAETIVNKNIHALKSFLPQANCK